MNATKTPKTAAADAEPATAIAPEDNTPSFDHAKTQMHDGVLQAMRYWQDSVAFGQGNLAALMQSSKIMTAGLQEISKQVAQTGKANIEQSVAFTKSLIGAKTVRQAAELQADYLKSTLQNALGQTRDLAEATTKLSKQAAVPLTERAALASKLRNK